MFQQTAGQLFSSTSGGCQKGGRRRKSKRVKRKSNNKRNSNNRKKSTKRRRRRRKQHGGAALVGATFGGMNGLSQVGMGRGHIGSSFTTSTCSSSGQNGGGKSTSLQSTEISNIGNRPQMKLPGYGFDADFANDSPKGSYPIMKSYDNGSCPQGGGGKKKKKRKKKGGCASCGCSGPVKSTKKKSKKKSKRKSKSKRKGKRKKKGGMGCATHGKNKKRRRRSRRKGQRGGGTNVYSFTGAGPAPLGSPIGAGDVTVGGYNNCFTDGTYNHYESAGNNN